VSALVISTKQEEFVWVPNLERPQIEHTLQHNQIEVNELYATGLYLNTEVASVNIVSQEEIPRGSGVAADLEEFHQVVLAMISSGCVPEQVFKVGRNPHIGREYRHKL
jgi:hypothetical protein